MALADLIDAKFQTLSQRVTVNSNAVSKVISITHDKSWDQNTASCVITVGTELAQDPNNTTEVKVYEGYGGLTAVTFTGYVDEWKAGSFPNTWELHCRDKLKRAEQVWLKDTPVTFTSAQAEAAVADLLSRAGLAVTAGTTNFTIGDVKPAEFKLVSIMDAVNQIAALIGWKVWQDVDGTLYFQYRKPRPAATSVWTYTYGQNILKRTYSKTDKDLRNRVVVLGYWNPTATSPIRAETYAASSFTDVDIVATLSSELIDTQSMADTIAAWMLTDLNTLCYVYDFDCPGNPLVRVGDTIHIVDATKSVDNNFFVFSLQSEFKEDSFIYHVTAVRWDNASVVNYEPPTPPAPVLPPPGVPGGCMDRSCTPGKGNLLYARTSLKGIAKCIQANDGVPSWSAFNNGLTGDGLKVRWFTFDPFSLEGDHFTRAYAMSVDGLHRCDGMPDSHLWTTKLTKAAAAALLGVSAGDMVFQMHFAPDYWTANWVGVMAGYWVYNSYGNAWYRYYLLESNDRGETWAKDNGFFIDIAGDGIGWSLRLIPSPHIPGTLYLSFPGADWYQESLPGERSPYLGIFKRAGGVWSRAASIGNNSYHAGVPYFPWTDGAGQVYADDNACYSPACAWESGAQQITKTTSAFTPPWSAGYTPPVWSPVGDPNMTLSYIPALGLASMELGIDMWDGDNLIAWMPYGVSFTGTGYPLWVSSDGAGSWVQRTRPTVAGRSIEQIPGGYVNNSGLGLFQCPADPNVLFIIGRPHTGAGAAIVLMSKDGGVTWTDISKTGLADGIDTVLGLTVPADLGDQASIFVDYYKE